MGLLIKPDGTAEPVKPAEGKSFTLKELQGFVGGYIELVRVEIEGYPFVAFINEEGKMNDLPLNVIATRISGLFPHDVIVGNMIVCDEGEVD